MSKGSKGERTKIREAGDERVPHPDRIAAKREIASASSSQSRILSRHDESGSIGITASDEWGQQAKNTARDGLTRQPRK